MCVADDVGDVEDAIVSVTDDVCDVADVDASVADAGCGSGYGDVRCIRGNDDSKLQSFSRMWKGKRSFKIPEVVLNIAKTRCRNV